MHCFRPTVQMHKPELLVLCRFTHGLPGLLGRHIFLASLLGSGVNLNVSLHSVSFTEKGGLGDNVTCT